MMKHHHAQNLPNFLLKRIFKNFESFREIFSFFRFRKSENFQISIFFTFISAIFRFFSISYQKRYFRNLENENISPKISNFLKIFFGIFFLQKFRNMILHHVIQSHAMNSAQQRRYFDCSNFNFNRF